MNPFISDDELPDKLKIAQKALEKDYGALGDAQKAELERLLKNKARFDRLAVIEQWRVINQNLAQHEYRPPAKVLTMEQLLQKDSFVPKFLEDHDKVDMAQLLGFEEKHKKRR
ncbi:MAG: hypothetical protein RL095_2355 [Verrucomicrobiota bacterium]|jgi:uncharacterized protein YdcH (DUF465 family)